MYNKLLFNCGRGNQNCEALSTAGITHYYVNTDDTIFGSGANNITSSGYFPPYFGFKPGQVLINDLIFFRGADGTAWGLITEVTPDIMITLYPNIVPQKTLTKTVNVSGPWASPISVNLKWIWNGNQVTMTCSSAALSAASISSFINFPAGVLSDVGITPALDAIQFEIPGSNNSVSVPVTLTIESSGDMNVSVQGSDFTASGLGGFQKFCVTYEGS